MMQESFPTLINMNTGLKLSLLLVMLVLHHLTTHITNILQADERKQLTTKHSVTKWD